MIAVAIANCLLLSVTVPLPRGISRESGAVVEDDAEAAVPVLAGAGAGEFVAEIVGRVEAISAGTHPLAPLPAAAAEEDSAPIATTTNPPSPRTRATTSVAAMRASFFIVMRAPSAGMPRAHDAVLPHAGTPQQAAEATTIRRAPELRGVDGRLRRRCYRPRSDSATPGPSPPSARRDLRHPS